MTAIYIDADACPDPFFQGKGKPFSKVDRSNFLNALEREVRAAQRDV